MTAHTRRSFFARMAALAGAVVVPANLLDPEFELWTPGQKKLILPPRQRLVHLEPTAESTWGEFNWTVVGATARGYYSAPVMQGDSPGGNYWHFNTEDKDPVWLRLDATELQPRPVFWSEDPPWDIGLLTRKEAGMVT